MVTERFDASIIALNDYSEKILASIYEDLITMYHYNSAADVWDRNGFAERFDNFLAGVRFPAVPPPAASA
jgi:hypothetical protein